MPLSIHYILRDLLFPQIMLALSSVREMEPSPFSILHRPAEFSDLGISGITYLSLCTYIILTSPLAFEKHYMKVTESEIETTQPTYKI